MFGSAMRGSLCLLCGLLLVGALGGGCADAQQVHGTKKDAATDRGADIWLGPPDVVPRPDVVCSRAQCESGSTRYCGLIGDGCGGSLDCGECPSGQVCGAATAHVCSGGADCKPLTCDAGITRYCGTIGDGCGAKLECGDCPNGDVCGSTGMANVCPIPPPPGCTPLACASSTNGQYCGKIGDGCNGALDCGDCPDGQICGGAGVPHLCPAGPDCPRLTCDVAGGRFCGTVGDGCGGALDCGACRAGFTCTDGVCHGGADCPRLTCTPAGGRYCGRIGDGCGDALDCGACPAGQVCNAGICVGGPECPRVACESNGARYCGHIGDGCGGALDCGDCPQGQTCGAGGVAGVCPGSGPVVPPNCQPITCGQGRGKYCGTIGDGCGRALDCGGCDAPETCGATVAHVCGGTDPNCPKLTCSAGTWHFCGKIGDGCGGTLDCGTCPAGQVCGSASLPGVCLPSTGCQPLACKQAAGSYCGKIGDGCGGTLDCGTCPAGQICGGALANVCGGTPCTNLCTKRVTCTGSATTAISGTVYAPTPPRLGQADPIVNALVYVPNATVTPFPSHVTCGRCGAEVSGSPLVSATTGSDGKFLIENMPAGDNIPLVIQLGRWRRQVVIPHVEPCTTTPLPAELTRLPRNKSEGDIPLMAMATGKVDTLECVLRKIGIEDAEFTLPTGTGRVHVYQQNGAVLNTPTPWASSLWADPTALARYDMVLLACEGAPLTKTWNAQRNMIAFADAGGRVFATHFSYTWLYNVAPFSNTAAWNVKQDAPHDPLTGFIDQTYPKGQAFARWLSLVGASTKPGEILIRDPRHDLDAVVAPTQRWIYSTYPNTVQHLTFNTPVGVAESSQCGRVLYSDFHVTDVQSAQGVTFPKECADEPLTAQEKVLEYMLFDLASCVQSDSEKPNPLPPAPELPPAPPSLPPAPPPSAPDAGLAVAPPLAPPSSPPSVPAAQPPIVVGSPPAVTEPPQPPVPPPPAPPPIP